MSARRGRRAAPAAVVLAVAGVLLGSTAPAPPLAAETAKIKVLADQDSAGPHGTNFLSLLMLLNAPQIDLLGITSRPRD